MFRKQHSPVVLLCTDGCCPPVVCFFLFGKGSRSSSLPKSSAEGCTRNRLTEKQQIDGVLLMDQQNSWDFSKFTWTTSFFLPLQNLPSLPSSLSIKQPKNISVSAVVQQCDIFTATFPWLPFPVAALFHNYFPWLTLCAEGCFCIQGCMPTAGPACPSVTSSCSCYPMLRVMCRAEGKHTPFWAGKVPAVKMQWCQRQIIKW